jgi:hypothetical protein
MFSASTGKKTAAWLVVLGTLALPAGAADFALLANRSGNNGVVNYSLVNNSVSLEAVDFTLWWNPLDPVDDNTKAKANFDPISGYLQPYPSGWWPCGGDSPWYATTSLPKAVKPGQTLGEFKTKQKGPVAPEWFTVGYYSGSSYYVSDPFYIAECPEPGSLMTIAAGLIACALGRRKSLLGGTLQ